MKKETFLGNIALTALVHETIMHNGRGGIFIPIEGNPCIFYQKKEDGTRIINLDIEVKPTPNGKYGNTHLVKASVGKSNRDKYGIKTNDQLAKATPILGNLKRFEFEVKDGQGQGQQPAQQYGGGYGQGAPAPQYGPQPGYGQGAPAPQYGGGYPPYGQGAPAPQDQAPDW